VGAPLGTLRVDVRFQTVAGLRATAPIGLVAGDGRSAPTLPMPVLANLLALLPGDRTRVTFRFTPVGAGAAYEIDDVHVDPYSRR